VRRQDHDRQVGQPVEPDPGAVLPGRFRLTEVCSGFIRYTIQAISQSAISPSTTVVHFRQVLLHHPPSDN
jgi:hypothetical protein